MPAEPHLDLGYGYFVLGQYEKAIAETMEALRLDPDNSNGYTNLIQGYAFTNQLREAKATCQEAMKRNP
jgi:tetratricopeptide (TPR) repeat protein